MSESSDRIEMCDENSLEMQEMWIEYVQESARTEALLPTYDICNSFHGIPTYALQFANELAEYFEAKPYVKYLMLQIYNKYICFHFSEIERRKEQYEGEIEFWFKNYYPLHMDLCENYQLDIILCFYMANKMDNRNEYGWKLMHLSEIMFHITDEIYPVKDIRDREWMIYKTIQLKIPTYTHLECIQTLISITSTDNVPNILNMSISLLDSAYLEHEDLFAYLFAIYHNPRESTPEIETEWRILRLNPVFLSSVIILNVMSKRYMFEQQRHVARKLSEILNMNTDKLMLLNKAFLLFLYLLEHERTS